MMTKDDWENVLDANPTDWKTRLVYSDWLEENDNYRLAKAQRWLVAKQKTPGPGCVQESEWFEASWFTEYKAGQRWSFPDRNLNRVNPQWCLNHSLFVQLEGYFTTKYGNRRSDFHNDWGRCYGGRRYAEEALSNILGYALYESFFLGAGSHNKIVKIFDTLREVKEYIKTHGISDEWSYVLYNNADEKCLAGNDRHWRENLGIIRKGGYYVEA